MRIEAHALSGTGDRRVNEDAWRIEIGPSCALLAIADGLGGHAGGGEAARCCLDRIAAEFGRQPDLSDAGLQALADLADRAVSELRAASGASRQTMRTTLAMFAINDGQARCLHAGDSRGYRFRAGHLVERTRDHSVAELLATVGDDAGFAPADPADRNHLLRAIGGGTGAGATLGEPFRLEAGDALLLCTDGLWTLVDEETMESCLGAATSPAGWAAMLAERADERAKQAPNEERDNYSMICAMVMPAASTVPT